MKKIEANKLKLFNKSNHHRFEMIVKNNISLLTLISFRTILLIKNSHNLGSLSSLAPSMAIW